MWGKITVQKYQELMRISETENDDIDKLAYSVCVLWDKRPEEVDGWPADKFLKYADKVTRVFQAPPKAVILPWQRLRLTTDAQKITFGQFVEMQHWVRNGVTDNLHMIGATLMGDTAKHTENATRLLQVPVLRLLEPVNRFLESWEALLRSYSGLFELDEETDPDAKPEDPHPFIEQYGWIYTAKKVAEHEGVKLDDVWEIGVVQALNDMAFLKSQAKYEQWLQKR